MTHRNLQIVECDMYQDFPTDPRFKVGDFNLIGTQNRYDAIAKKVAAPYFTDKNECIAPIPSGLNRVSVVKIEKLWRPKPESQTRSWFHRGDYSKNKDFEQYWYVKFSRDDLWYELADLIS